MEVKGETNISCDIGFIRVPRSINDRDLATAIVGHEGRHAVLLFARAGQKHDRLGKMDHQLCGEDREDKTRGRGTVKTERGVRKGLSFRKQTGVKVHRDTRDSCTKPND